MSLHQNVVLDPNKITVLEVSARCDATQADGTIKKIVNVYHFVTDTPPASGDWDPDDVLTQFKSAIQDAIMAAVSNNSTFTLAEVKCLNSPFPLKGDHTYSVVGSISGDRLPTDQAATIQINTGISSRNFKGSKHFGPLAESYSTLDQLNGTGSVPFAAIRDTIASPLTFTAMSQDYHLVILSKTLSDLGSVSPTVSYADVTGASLNLRIGSMNRRKQRAAKTVK